MSRWLIKGLVGISIVALWVSESRAKAPTTSQVTDPEVLKAIEATEKQSEINEATNPVCPTCETAGTPTPVGEELKLPPRDDCWDDTAIHKFIMESDFSKSPEIVSRKEWGARPYSKGGVKKVVVGKNGKKTVVTTRSNRPQPLVKDAEGPSTIVIHHTAGPEKTYGIKQIQYDHQHRKKPMPDIGYHFAIGFDPDRKKWVIYEGVEKNARIVTPEGIKEILGYGSHAFKKNSNRIGIVLMGQYDSKQQADFDSKHPPKPDPLNPIVPKTEGDKRPPPEAVQLLGQLVNSLMKEYPTIRDITGHGSGFHYTCASDSDGAIPGENEEDDDAETGEGVPRPKDADLLAPNYSVPSTTKYEDLRYDPDPNKMVKEAYTVTVKGKKVKKYRMVRAPRYTECPGDHVYQIVESMRTKFLGEGKGFFVNEDAKKGVPGFACLVQRGLATPSPSPEPTAQPTPAPVVEVKVKQPVQKAPVKKAPLKKPVVPVKSQPNGRTG